MEKKYTDDEKMVSDEKYIGSFNLNLSGYKI